MGIEQLRSDRGEDGARAQRKEPVRCSCLTGRLEVTGNLAQCLTKPIVLLGLIDLINRTAPPILIIQLTDRPKEQAMKHLTTAAGAPVVDNQNTQTAGPRGPVLLQDVWAPREAGAFRP